MDKTGVQITSAISARLLDGLHTVIMLC
jgi:hypothetical protein